MINLSRKVDCKKRHTICTSLKGWKLSAQLLKPKPGILECKEATEMASSTACHLVHYLRLEQGMHPETSVSTCKPHVKVRCQRAWNSMSKLSIHTNLHLYNVHIYVSPCLCMYIFIYTINWKHYTEPRELWNSECIGGQLDFAGYWSEPPT